MRKWWKPWQTLFSWAPKSLQMVIAATKLKEVCPLEESYDKPRQHIEKQRHHFAEKVCIVKDMVFPVVMYRCENWTIKKGECWRTDAFEWWCWRRLLKVPWTARRSNQSILREINPEHLLKGLLLKLNLLYFGHQLQRANPLEKTLMLGMIEGKSRRGQQNEMVR